MQDASRLIGHVNVLVGTSDAAVFRILQGIGSARALVWGFCNAHTVNMARTNGGFREALRSMFLFNDGIGVDIASRILYGASFPENLNGTDLTPALLRLLPDSTRLFLIGSAPGVAEDAAEALSRDFKNVRIVGIQHGFFAEEEEPLISARIVGSRAQLVLVGMGHPRQELWATRSARLVNTTFLCVGAFLDFSAGKVSRAPDIVRRLRFEWLYRLIVEPRRLARRYVVGNLTFLVAIVRQRLARS